MSKKTKGKIGTVDDMRELPFNPSTFEKLMSIDWNSLSGAGSNYPYLVFNKGNVYEIPLELYLNATEGHNVENFINFINSFVPAEKRTGELGVPPKDLIFAFGKFVKRVKVSDLKILYLAFDSETLAPIEAKISLTLKIKVSK